MRSPAIRLVVQHGSVELFARPFDKPSLTIGRLATCDVMLDADDVSSVQATITLAAGGDAFVVKDVGWIENVRVNGAKVDEAVVALGAEIEIGEFRLCVEHAPAESEPSPQPKRSPPPIEAPEMALVPDGDVLIATPLAKVLWAATSDEMSDEPITGEIPIGEPVYLLTRRKVVLGRPVHEDRQKW